MTQPVENVEVNQTKEYERYIQPVRLIPVWLKIIIVIALIIVFTMIGAVIGFGVIGEGKPLDALKIDTWTHLYDLINP